MTFEGIVGSSYTGDLAIDDVSIRRGNCQGHATSPTFSTTPIFSPSVTSDPSSHPSSQASSSSGQSASIPSTNGPSSSSSLPSAAVSGIFYLPSFLFWKKKKKEKNTFSLIADRTRYKVKA